MYDVLLIHEIEILNPPSFHFLFYQSQLSPGLAGLMELFSCARRIKYGLTSLIGPKGKYLLTAAACFGEIESNIIAHAIQL